MGRNKSKGKAQIAKGKAAAATAIVQKSRVCVFTFVFCALRFAF